MKSKPDPAGIALIVVLWAMLATSCQQSASSDRGQAQIGVADSATSAQQAAIVARFHARNDSIAQAGQRLADEQAKKARLDHERMLIRNHSLEIGISGDLALRILGIQPEKVNRTVTASGTSDQWVMNKWRAHYYEYVYLDNGIVTGWQQ